MRAIELIVSIRAPARGATVACGAGVYNSLFRSAPPHGGRRGSRHPVLLPPLFRSAPPHGGRRPWRPCRAPARCFDPRPRTGGDRCALADPITGSCFDPRPRTGGDMPLAVTCWFHVCFDPRPRTGGDMRAKSSGLICFGFDPRPRTGGDKKPLTDALQAKVSIRAPARGATARLRGDVDVDAMFRSAPPHGGRRWLGITEAYSFVSIRAPARGATMSDYSSWGVNQFCFDPRPRTGGDQPKRKQIAH